MGVSKNRGTPKSSILIGFSIVNHPFWGPIPIFGNTQMGPNFSRCQVMACVCHNPWAPWDSSHCYPRWVSTFMALFQEQTDVGCQPKNMGKPPQIIHFNRVWNHYFHHPFWGFSPYFWKHPVGEILSQMLHVWIIYLHERWRLATFNGEMQVNIPLHGAFGYSICLEFFGRSEMHRKNILRQLVAELKRPRFC